MTEPRPSGVLSSDTEVAPELLKQVKEKFQNQPAAPPRPKVYVGNVNPGTVNLWFTKSLLDLVNYDHANKWGLWAGCLWSESGANISSKRNEIVRRFLDHTDGDWLLFLDSDMVFPPDTIARLLGAATKVNTKIIGGLCVMIGELGPVPTLYQHDTMAGSAGITRVQLDYADDALVQVAATGGACLMVHRDALETYRAAQADNKRWLLDHKDEPLIRDLLARDLIHDPSEENGWFSERVRGRRVLTGDGEVSAEHWISEDIEFCLRLGSLGFDLWVDCTLEVGHRKHGRTWYAHDIRDSSLMPKPPIVAVIPVKDRLGLTRDLIGQIREQGGCDEIIVCDNGSGRETKNWLGSQNDLTVLDMPEAGIHEMWNAGVARALEKHGTRCRVAFLNNDLKLGPAFLKTLSQALTDHRDYAAVCGNYDGRRHHEPIVATSEICANRYDGTGGFAGFAFMVRGEWFTSGYRFPEECKWWFGDNDLLMALNYASEDTANHAGIVVAAEVEHIGGGGKTAGDPLWSDFEEQTAKDREAFEARWAEIRRVDEARARLAAGDLTPLYEKLCDTPSDINEHLATLHDLAVKLEARKVIELGVRTGVSSVAWLTALQQTDGHLFAVDTNMAPDHVVRHPRCTFIQGDDLDPFVVAQTGQDADVVFIDTDHRYQLTKDEIDAYRHKVRPGGCMVFHDTAVETFDHHEPGSEPPFPVRTAVEEWAEREGLPVDRYDHNNGLTVVWL